MTEREEAEQYERLTPAGRLRAQMEGRQPKVHAVVRVENSTARRRRMVERLFGPRLVGPKKGEAR